MSRLRCYLNPFTTDGSAYAGWQEVTGDVFWQSLSTIQLQLDVSDYDVGVFTNSGFTIDMRNNQGKYSDVGTSFSIFDFKRADTQIKITYDQSDNDYQAGFANSDDVLHNEVELYLGILNDDSTVMQLADQSIEFQVLGYESILDRIVIDSDWGQTALGLGAPPTAGANSTTLVQRIFAIAALVSPGSLIFTVDNTKLVPGVNISWDSVASFPTMTLKAALEAILTAENSVLYMSGTTPIVSARTPGALEYTFRGPASSLGPENIIDIQDISSGLNRTFNYVTWAVSSTDVRFSSDAASITQYGARVKSIDPIDGITADGTIDSILSSIEGEFSLPKQELTLFSTMNYDTIGLGLLSLVEIDYPLVPIDPNPPIYGVAIYDQAEYPTNVSTFTIDTSTPFKVIGIQYDLANKQVVLNLREI